MSSRSTLPLTLPLTLVACLMAACATAKLPDVTTTVSTMGWHAHPDADVWTAATMAAVASHDAELSLTTPADITTFCPHYPKAGLTERRTFWVGLLSATARYESGFNPKAAGGGGRYIGLMQISPSTARQSGCTAATPAALKDGTANLVCAVEIFAPHVAADGMVAGSGKRGIGRDWGPFAKASIRTDIANWTAKQSYCQG